MLIENEPQPLEGEYQQAGAYGQDPVALRERQQMMLDAFLMDLLERRDDAIEARVNSGIEDIWLEDEEFYQGIDDWNRWEMRAVSLPARAKGQLSPPKPGDANYDRSTVFLNITAPFTDAAAARVSDMILPIDEPCWGIGPTPMPELGELQQAMLQRAGLTMEQALQLQETVFAKATERSKLMAAEIEDHLTECQWHGQVRSVIQDAARLGTGIIKGPYPKRSRRLKWTVGVDGAAQLGINDDPQPISKWISVWNFFPDGSCGENIHKGSYVWERTYITAKEVKEMARRCDPQFKNNFRKILDEGPKPCIHGDKGLEMPIPVKGQYEMWTMYGQAAADHAVAYGLLEPMDDDSPLSHVDVCVDIINDEIVGLDLTYLETGEFPYDVLAWQARPDVPWGTGIARLIRTAQRMLNAATRAMMDNAGLTAAPQIVIGQGVTPATGGLTIAGRAVWQADNTVADVRKVFYCYIPDSHQQEFMAIINFALTMAERTTGQTLLMQGQSEEGAKDRPLGVVQIMQTNASGVLRRLAKRFDDFLTEPHIRRYYNYLMQWSDNAEIKQADLQVDARASSALIERDTQKQFLFTMMTYSVNPAYGLNPAKVAQELAKSERLQPERLQYTEEEKQAAANQAPSQLDQAKATLTLAQAALADSKAVSTKVESQFSAINTAIAALMNPGAGTVADVSLKSAGYQDSDQPPIIGAPPPGYQPPAAAPVGSPTDPQRAATAGPANTSPSFPPNPDRGMNAGIEGGPKPIPKPNNMPPTQ